MKIHLRQIFHNLINAYFINEEKQIKLPQIFLLALKIQQALICLSYICENKTNTYINILSFYARPQLYLPESNLFQYMILGTIIIYILNIFIYLPLAQYIRIFGQVLKSSLINFIFEYSQGILQNYIRSIIIVLSLFEVLLLQETLNIQIINFQEIIMTQLDYCYTILNILIMIFYSYNQSKIIIIIIGFIMNFIYFINLMQYKILENQLLKQILISISIFTLLIEIQYQFNFYQNFNTELVLFPIIFQLIKLIINNQNNIKYEKFKKQQIFSYNSNILFRIEYLDLLKIEKMKTFKDKMLLSSILIKKGQYYYSLIQLQQINSSKINLIYNYKKNILIKYCKSKMEYMIDLKCGSNPIITSNVQKLIKSEEENYLILQEIISLMKQKIQIQQLLIGIQNNKTYSKYLNYIEKLLNVKILLEKQYQEFNSEKSQNILTFFYIEIMNDILHAVQLQNISTISDEKINKITQNYELFSNKMIYLIATFDKQLKITRASNGAGQFFNCQNKELIGGYIAQFVPPIISDYHDDLIKQFLDLGDSKFIRKINQNYLYNQKMNMIETIDMIFEIDFTIQLNFIAFIQPVQTQKMIIILDNKLNIRSFSLILINELNLQEQSKYYFGINITKILKDIEFNAQIEFINGENVEATFDHYIDIDGSQICTQTYIYQTTFQIQFGKIKNQLCYAIIKFDYFKKINSQSFQSASCMSPNTYKNDSIKQGAFEELEMFVNEESRVKIPYKDITEAKINSTQQIQLIQNSINLISQDLNQLDQKFQLEHTNLISPSNQNEKLINSQLFFTKERKTKHNFFSSQSIESEHNFHGKQENVFHDDGASQVSSLQEIKKSKYFKKYELIYKINYLKSFQTNHTKFILVLLCCIISQLLIQIVQLIQTNSNLINLAIDIDLLQIENFVFQPLETFLVTRWSIVNYNNLKDANSINTTQYNQLVKFPRSNLGLGYDSLSENLKEIFNRQALQSFLENTILNISIYKTTGIGDIYNLSLRNSISILMSYQYTFKMAYIIDGRAVADSPYVYYQYRNYLPIKYQFNQLANNVLMDTINRQIIIQEYNETLFILIIVIFLFFIYLIIFYYSKIQRKINKFYLLMNNIQTEYIEFDLIRLKDIIDQLNKDNNLLFKYCFNLERKEAYYDTNNKHIASIKKSNNHFAIFTHEHNFYYLLLSILSVLVLLNSLLTFLECQNYLNKYPATAKFFKSFADLGTDVPTMYAQREVLYGRANFVFYSSTDLQNIFLQITDSLSRTIQFSQQDIDFTNIIISQQFQNKFQSVMQSNLCNYLPTFLIENASTLCPIVMNSNMQRGLRTILTYIINFITTDMENNNFTIRISPSYLELEGAFIVSNIIKDLNDDFKNDLNQQTQSFVNTLNVHNIILLLLMFFLIGVVIIFVKNKLTIKQLLVHRLIHILPLKTILFDDNFERNLREIIILN